MIREEYLQRLVEESHLDLYLSANDGARMTWPWRMQPPAEATNTYRATCDHYVIDSEPQSPAVTNQDVLDCAAKYDADAVLLVDYWPFEMYEAEPGPLYAADGEVKDEADLAAYEELRDQYDSAYEASLASVRRGLDMAETHPFDGEVWAPLQEPYEGSFEALGRPETVALGGLKDAPAGEKVRAAKAIREVAGPDVHIHGLGFGVTEPLAAAVQADPSLLDSIDYSTPVQDPMREGIAHGDEYMSVVAAKAAAILIDDLRAVTPFPDSAPTRQTGLADFTNRAAIARGGADD